MAVRRRYDESLVSESAAATAGRLITRLSEVNDAIYDTLTAEIAELRVDQHLLDLLRASIEGNVDTIFHALQCDIPLDHIEPPTASLEYARRLAQHGVPVNALVRAYRLGQQVVTNRLLTEIIAAPDLDPDLGLWVVARMTTLVAGYIDWISQQVVTTYEDERERWLETRNSVRAVRVRELLGTAGEVDVDAVSTAIRYPLRRTHLALVIWYADESGNELGRLERFLRDLTDALGASENALFIAADRVTAWAWIPLASASAAEIPSRIREFVGGETDAPRVALGTAMPGVDGFRRSHRQAQSARTVAIAAGAKLTAAGDPGLAAVALLAQNLPEAQVWVCETLGPLAADTENDARLRETLRVFLQRGSSYKAAAEDLVLHFNSVKYRVQRAVERRGRPIGDDRLDVEIALLMCHWFGTAVLAPA
ncbi:MAG TPA: helix-turn-helix domain-containing protein [Aldersonia sp.]